MLMKEGQQPEELDVLAERFITLLRDWSLGNEPFKLPKVRNFQ
jgi:hypothetical protein